MSGLDFASSCCRSRAFAELKLTIKLRRSAVLLIRKNQFDFQDFLDQLQQIKKMGNLKDLMGMIPGVGKAMKDIDIKDDAFKGIEAMISSMTPFERSNPDSLTPSRKQRIAKGSGKDLAEINAFMKQFEQMKQMMKMMNNMPMGKFPGMRR